MKTINFKGKGEHSVNELELIIEQQAEELHLIKSGQKQLILSGVVTSVLCVSDEIDCLNITKGKKYTLIESDNVFFRVVNDLGNEQLYYNYRFKRL